MLGDLVRKRRRDLDLTQEQLAAATGLKQFHISRIEKGDIHDVKGDTLRRLALALHVTSDFLLGIAPQPKPKPKRTRVRQLALIE
jgi:transcriptional regulator with XRE-family HTH domain